MGLYDFKERFVRAILEGSKTHTIRAIRKDGRVDKAGKDVCHCYTRLRTKRRRLLGRFPCVKVEEIHILGDPAPLPPLRFIVDGIQLNWDEGDALARRDGFSSVEDMAAFWRGRLPFAGHIVHWDYRRRST